MKQRKVTAASSIPQLPESEWAFHRIPDTEIAAAAHWERMRHQGDTQYFLHQRWFDLSKPWLDQPEADKQILSINTYSAFTELPLTADILRILSTKTRANLHWHLGLFSVNLNASDAELVSNFRVWLKSRRAQLGPPRQLPNEPERFPASRLPFKMWLTDIACWRAVKSGLSRADAVRLLRPLRTAWYGESKETVQSRFTSRHWNKNLMRAKRLAERHEFDRS